MPASDQLPPLLRNPIVLAALVGLVIGLLLRRVDIGMAAFTLTLAARLILPNGREPRDGSVQERLAREIMRRGADYASYSAADRRAIGYDVDRKVLILGSHDRQGIHAMEYPLKAVRDVTWSRPEAGHYEVFGTVGAAAALQVGLANAAAEHRARASAGLHIELADIETPQVTVSLDADEGRMRRWMEILRQAFEDTLIIPGRPVHI